MNSPSLQTFHHVPGNRALLLRNKTCVYCGQTLDPQTRTKEHVIARHFVPKGTLNAAWNLIAYCCRRCNNAKSELEDDIAAIVLQPNTFGEHIHNDPRLATEAQRKARHSFHRRTGKPVQDSKSSIALDLALTPGVKMGVSFTGPPELDPLRAARLAQLQITAFCYLTTFNQTTLSGQFCRGGFSVLNGTMRSDWGNESQLDFAQLTEGWSPCLYSSTADGYFKVIIRRHSEGCRSWALEWNRNFRILGFMGDSALIDQLTVPLRRPEYHASPSTAPGEQYRIRQERPIGDADDLLFAWPGDSSVWSAS